MFSRSAGCKSSLESSGGKKPKKLTCSLEKQKNSHNPPLDEHRYPTPMHYISFMIVTNVLQAKFSRLAPDFKFCTSLPSPQAGDPLGPVLLIKESA